MRVAGDNEDAQAAFVLLGWFMKGTPQGGRKVNFLQTSAKGGKELRRLELTGYEAIVDTSCQPMQSTKGKEGAVAPVAEFAVLPPESELLRQKALPVPTGYEAARSLLFRASSHEEKREWIEALVEVVNLARRYSYGLAAESNDASGDPVVIDPDLAIKRGCSHYYHQKKGTGMQEGPPPNVLRVTVHEGVGMERVPHPYLQVEAFGNGGVVSKCTRMLQKQGMRCMWNEVIELEAAGLGAEMQIALWDALGPLQGPLPQPEAI